ncbi:MAG: hypothetical protein K2W82_10080 [Candidatus Obscuribacterales bacterium]|jgi:hypothetical protein|nr:hypothetical protein [Candidatus Obscuribacterales bacterium]
MPHLSHNPTFTLIRITALILFACFTLSGCRDGKVDSGCYWGPIPNHKKLEKLKALGVKTIVNCRMNPLVEKEKEVRAMGMNFVHIRTGLFEAPGEEEIRKFLNVARNPEMRPLYICDQVARDRTQFYAGVYGMVAQDWSAEYASWRMYRNGLRHWWPWFYKYKDVVKEYEDRIHDKTAMVGTIRE